MKKTICTLAVTAGLSALAAPAQAQFAKTEDAIRYRQSGMFLMGNNMGRIGAQLKSGSPNVQVIQSSAALIEVLARVPFEGFVAGSESGGTPPTRAKAEVFLDADKFKAAAEKMQTEVAKLGAAAKGGDLGAIKAQFGATGKTCKGCHDDYRKE